MGNGHAAWDEALDEGRRLPFDAAIGYALASAPLFRTCALRRVLA